MDIGGEGRGKEAKKILQAGNYIYIYIYIYMGSCLGKKKNREDSWVKRIEK